METDLTLLTRYHRDGDAGAFQALIRAHAGMVFAAARRITHDAALAEEVAQDTFLALARRGQSIRESVAAWLHHVARQKAGNVLRGELRRQRHEQVAAELLLEKQDGSWAEIEPVVDEVIDELPENLRALLIEHFLQQRSQQEMAARLGMSQSTVSRQIETALQMLREGLKRKGVMGGIGLAVLLSTSTAQAAPATLTASLNKIAMTGIRSAPAGTATTSAFLFTLTTTTKALLATAVVVSISMAFLLPRNPPPTLSVVEPAQTPPLSPKPQPANSRTKPPNRQNAVPVLDQVLVQAEPAAVDDRELILAEFKRRGGAITQFGEEWLDDEIASVIQKQFNNDRAAFEYDLAQKGQTPEQFRTLRGEAAIILIEKARVTKGIIDPVAKQRAIDAWLMELRLKAEFPEPAAAAKSADVD
jgi:RNA polymerase sigma factor (sigma-70 family)